jgi:hypothetical protein
LSDRKAEVEVIEAKRCKWEPGHECINPKEWRKMHHEDMWYYGISKDALLGYTFSITIWHHTGTIAKNRF